MAAGLLAVIALGAGSTLYVRRLRADPPRWLPVAPERGVITGFAPESQPDAPYDRNQALAPGRRHFFWVEIGPPVTRPPAATAGVSDVRLRVALYAFSHEIAIDSAGDVGEFSLPFEGPARVVQQAADPARLPAEAEIRGRRLFFSVRMPGREGAFRLRCSIYCNNVLVQSREVTAQVREPALKVHDAQRPTVDYTLARTLDPRQLARLAPHRLSIMLNSSGDDVHGLRFFAENFKGDADIDGLELQNFIDTMRGALRTATWGDDQPWQANKPYRYAGPADLARLRADLVHLAIAGYRCYDQVVERLAHAGGVGAVDTLEQLLREPGRIQVATRMSGRYMLPAALLYDYGLDDGVDERSFSLCPRFEAALGAAEPLEETDCFRGACPSRGAATVVCPSGFWGFRHYLGMPLSVPFGPYAPTALACRDKPQVAVAVSTDPIFGKPDEYETALKALRSDVGWHVAESREETFHLLKDQNLHLVYFYCHGGIDHSVPYLQVGAPNERGITRANLRFAKIHWDDPRPLVFINGCRTAAVEPETALNFVSGFVETAQAAGVIGTEITVFEPLARVFAEECLRRFLNNAEIGEAVRGARLALLKRGNPLGLVYIPFVLANLHLAEAAATLSPQLAA